MATRYLTRALISAANPLSRSYSSAVLPSSAPFVLRLRPLVAAVASSTYLRRVAPSARGFATRQTSSSLNDPNPNWSNRPPKETILLDGCDFEHWLIVMEKPENEPTRDEIIDSYIKTLAMVLGSEEEARMKIYSVSTRHYFAFGALVSEELSYRMKELPRVRWVLPDSYLDVKNKDYGGEPFINGQAVPYDPKYHEEWVRNNARANERNRRNDRPRNFDRSRNFERRRDMQMTNNQSSGPNVGGPQMGAPQNQVAPPPPNAGGMQPNMNYGSPPNNPGNYSRGPPPNNALNYQSGPPSGYQSGPPSGYQSGPPNGYQSGPGPNPGMGPGQGQSQSNAYPPTNMGGGNPPYQSQNGPSGPNPNNFSPNRGFGSSQNSGGFAPNTGYGPGPNQNNFGPTGQNQNSYAPNVGPGQGQHQGGYQNVPGRDPNY